MTKWQLTSLGPKHQVSRRLKQVLYRALDDEIEYIKKEGGSRFHQIRNGERITEVAGHFVYKFDFDGDRLETDVPVLLQIGDSRTA